MNDRLRLLPREFLAAWIETFSELPPEEFLETYETMCEGLYYGFKTRESWEGGSGRGRRLRPGYWFADPSLLKAKQRVDGRLAAIAAELRRWSKRRASQSTGGR